MTATKLSPKTNKTHGFVHYLGEKSGIRFFNHKNKEDMQRLKEITKSKQVKAWMDDIDIDDEDLLDWAKESKGNSYLYAVVGLQPTVSIEEEGKVQGFIYFYTGRQEIKRVKRLVEAGILPKTTLTHKMFEFSSARHPEAASGQMASAVRQALLEVRKLVRKTADNPRLPVDFFCYTHPNNTLAIRAFESACFTYKGKMKYDTDSPRAQNVYLLDWKKLKTKMTENALKATNP